MKSVLSKSFFVQSKLKPGQESGHHLYGNLINILSTVPIPRPLQTINNTKLLTEIYKVFHTCITNTEWCRAFFWGSVGQAYM